MMKYLLAAAMIVVCGCGEPELDLSGYDKSCTQDADCMAADEDVCGCHAGTRWAAINVSERMRYYSERDEAAKDCSERAKCVGLPPEVTCVEALCALKSEAGGE
jgi:hypothetical protein